MATVDEFNVFFDFKLKDESIRTKKVKFTSIIDGKSLKQLTQNEISIISNDVKIKRLTIFDEDFSRDVDIYDDSQVKEKAVITAHLEKHETVSNVLNSVCVNNMCTASPVSSVRPIEENDHVNEICQILKEKIEQKVKKPSSSGNELIQWRIELIKIVGSHLMITNNNEPKPYIKDLYSKALVMVYPELASGDVENSHLHVKAFIDQFCRNKRRRNPEIMTRSYKMKKTQSNNNLIEDLSEDDLRIIVNRMKNRVVNSNHLDDEVVEWMKITRNYRKNWILNMKPSVTEILNTYPKFLDYEFLIHDEFKFFYNEKTNNLISIWEQYLVPGVIKYSKTVDKEVVKDLLSVLDKGDESPLDADAMTLLAIKLLTLVVPTQNLKGRSNSRVNRCEVDRFVYLLINEGTPLEEIDEKISSYNTQPTLVIYQSTSTISQIFLKLDHQFLELKRGLLNALDILFKVFWIFNLEYPNQAFNFFNFLESIYNIGDNKKPTIEELKKLILNSK